MDLIDLRDGIKRKEIAQNKYPKKVVDIAENNKKVKKLKGGDTSKKLLNEIRKSEDEVQRKSDKRYYLPTK